MLITPARANEIAMLAETLSEENMVDGKVDLNMVAEKEGILLVHKRIDDSFLGLINYDKEQKKYRFCIFINKSQHKSIKAGWSRSTLGHELGHYFIMEHREELIRGRPLTFHGPNNLSNDMIQELEAQIFSMNLLMPRKQFVKKAKEYKPGMGAVIELSRFHKTPWSSTTFHYAGCNIIPCVVVKWNKKNEIEKKLVSKSFQSIVKRNSRMRFNLNRPIAEEEAVVLQDSRSEYNHCLTNLSSWVSNISREDKKDMVLVEESLNLGRYGGITLLFPTTVYPDIKKAEDILAERTLLLEKGLDKQTNKTSS